MEKLAVCSVVTKDFLIYLKVFCASIIKYTKNFDRDYIVYYFDNDLFDDDFIELKRLYSKNNHYTVAGHDLWNKINFYEEN